MTGLAQHIVNNPELDDFDKYIVIKGLWKRLNDEQRTNLLRELTVQENG